MSKKGVKNRKKKLQPKQEISFKEIVRLMKEEQKLRRLEVESLRTILASTKPITEPETLAFSLLSMSASVDDFSIDREVFGGSNYQKARQIGERLNEIGGWNLMSAVAYMLPRIDWNEIDRTWHGIGTWLC